MRHPGCGTISRTYAAGHDAASSTCSTERQGVERLPIHQKLNDGPAGRGMETRGYNT